MNTSCNNNDLTYLISFGKLKTVGLAPSALRNTTSREVVGSPACVSRLESSHNRIFLIGTCSWIPCIADMIIHQI